MSDLVKMPAEIDAIAVALPENKKAEVQKILNIVFDGVKKMERQLEVINVADEYDDISMRSAKNIRLSVREIRLQAEKQFDMKRTEVQQLMSQYKTEDHLWLKAKQIMQTLTKQIEESARYKEETKQRIEQERKTFRDNERMLLVQKYNNNIMLKEFSEMSDAVFTAFLETLKKQEDERIERERIERERIERERIEREEEQRKIKAENERLKAEAEKARIERERIELARKKEQAEAEARLKAEAEKARKLQEKLNKEQNIINTNDELLHARTILERAITAKNTYKDEFINAIMSNFYNEINTIAKTAMDKLNRKK